jgi:hypothetical protein
MHLSDDVDVVVPRFNYSSFIIDHISPFFTEKEKKRAKYGFESFSHTTEAIILVMTV